MSIRTKPLFTNAIKAIQPFRFERGVVYALNYKRMFYPVLIKERKNDHIFTWAGKHDIRIYNYCEYVMIGNNVVFACNLYKNQSEQIERSYWI